jgi:hypothetical protein
VKKRRSDFSGDGVDLMGLETGLSCVGSFHTSCDVPIAIIDFVDLLEAAKSFLLFFSLSVNNT